MCPGHNSSLPCFIWIIFHTIVVDEFRMCHDLDPRSFLQAKVAVHTYQKSVSMPKLLPAMLYPNNISRSCCSWPKDVSWSWPKIISLRSRSHCTPTRNLFPGHNSLLRCWIWIIFHTIVVHEPKTWPWPKVIFPRSKSQYTHNQNFCHTVLINPYRHVGSGCYFTQFFHEFDMGHIYYTCNFPNRTGVLIRSERLITVCQDDKSAKYIFCTVLIKVPSW